MRLKGKIAVITGGARGIGLATTRKFLEEGAVVAIWDIDPEKGADAVAHFEQQGHRLGFWAVDVSDPAATEQAARSVVDRFGRIDILLNNAGITRDAAFRNMSASDWQKVIDVNLSGVFHCTKAVYPFMAEQGYGRIVNASSVVGLHGNFGQTNYAAAKAGVIGMTKVWAREFGRKGITVNAVAPGFIQTEMMDTIPEKALNEFRHKTPLGRLGQPGEVAALYSFLASDEAAFITGTTVSIDGGLAI
ncbi:MAG TPA: beta-ketoacyl-ACP reductase [Flavilitoribacter sp.]|nr:beta-ketoacyl-ACP reductase [Flavilitoribacter sp.]HMQ90174.1 beta-ketoacyl-ACP reductase [Flavilitoribacter sp.]